MHAILSPSSASRWMLCAGAPRMEKGIVDETTEYQAEGTAAHFLAALCLTERKDPMVFFGKKIVVWSHPESESEGVDFAEAMAVDGVPVDPGVEFLFEFEVTPEMVGNVRLYVNAVLEAAQGGTLEVEWALPIGHLTGEPGAEGTADAAAVVGTRLMVRDLKYGKGKLVSAKGNRQLMLYALAAYDELSMLYQIDDVEIGIHQPRVAEAPDTHVLTVAELEAFRQQVKERGFHAWSVYNDEDEGAVVHHLTAGEEQCQWCKAKAKCPKIATEVKAAVGVDEFEDLTAPVAVTGMADDTLAAKYTACDLIEMFVAAVRAEVYARLNKGDAIPGYKLVAGKRGARAWRSQEEAEALLKSMRVKHDEMYSYSLISPTKAEELAKAGTIGQRQWPKLQALIVQPDGQPRIAKETDKAPALAIPAFDNLDAGDGLV